MQTINLSTPVFDVSGHWSTNRILDSTKDVDLRRRAQVVSTLDGGVVHQDFGFAHGDRELSIEFTIANLAEEDQVRYLVQTYPQLILTTLDGAFTVAPISFQRNRTTGTLILRVISKDA